MIQNWVYVKICFKFYNNIIITYGRLIIINISAKVIHAFNISQVDFTSYRKVIIKLCRMQVLSDN